MNETTPMKYAETRMVHIREVADRPGLPSQIFREIEAELIGRLARSVALSGRAFQGWPSVKIVTGGEMGYYYGDTWRLFAEVIAK